MTGLTSFSDFATLDGNDVLYDGSAGTILLLDVELVDFSDADLVL